MRQPPRLTQQKERLASVISWLAPQWAFRLATAAMLSQAVLGILVISWYWRDLPPAVPLWYSRPWGLERLAHPLWLLAILGINILFYGLNIILALKCTFDHPMFGRVLFLTSALLNALGLVIIFKVVTLVT